MGSSREIEKWAQAKVRALVRGALRTQAKEIVLIARHDAQALFLMAKRIGP